MNNEGTSVHKLIEEMKTHLRNITLEDIKNVRFTYDHHWCVDYCQTLLKDLEILTTQIKINLVSKRLTLVIVSDESTLVDSFVIQYRDPNQLFPKVLIYSLDEEDNPMFRYRAQDMKLIYHRTVLNSERKNVKTHTLVFKAQSLDIENI